MKEGEVDVDVSYKDPMGNVLSTSFSVRSTFFPYSKDYITTNFFAEGTYSEKLHAFKPGQNGQMGWKYNDGVNWSDYKYLVIKLSRAQSCNAHLNIFTENSIWGNGFSTANFGKNLQIVVNLQEAKYTSGDKTGQPLDLDNIRIVSFWGNGKGTVTLEDMYLTSNEDYSREDNPDGIKNVNVDDIVYGNENAVYDLSGRKINGHCSTINGLRKGIYIVNGKKILY